MLCAANIGILSILGLLPFVFASTNFSLFLVLSRTATCIFVAKTKFSQTVSISRWTSPSASQVTCTEPEASNTCPRIIILIDVSLHSSRTAAIDWSVVPSCTTAKLHSSIFRRIDKDWRRLQKYEPSANVATNRKQNEELVTYLLLSSTSFTHLFMSTRVIERDQSF